MTKLLQKQQPPAAQLQQPAAGSSPLGKKLFLNTREAHALTGLSLEKLRALRGQDPPPGVYDGTRFKYRRSALEAL
jgi:hypothetical protein